MGLNHVYKVIWNKTKGCYVVVSELAKRVGRNKAKAIVMATAAMAMVVTPAVMNVNQVEATVLIGSTNGTTISDSGSTVSEWGITIGGGITNAGSHTVHVGDATLEEGNRNVIIGTHATAGVDKIAGRHFVNQSVAIGSGANPNEGARAFGDQSIAIGANTIAEGNSSIAIGNDDVNKAVDKQITYTNPDGKEETNTLGKAYTNLTGKDLLTDGGQYADTRSGEAAVAIGVKAEAGDISLALGTGAKAKKVNTVSIGTGATADLDNSVAIGGGAVADKDSQGTKQTSTTINGITYAWAGGDKTNKGDIVSFGKPGFERQLKNIAAGEISSTSTDAINGSQIHSLVEKITGTPKLSYTTKDGTPVYKLGDKFYKVNEQGQPISAVGKPAVGTNEDGKLVDADKNVIEPIDPAVTPLKNALVNPNPAAGKTGTTSPTALNNITSNLVNFDAPNVNGKVPAKNALRNLVNDAVSDDTVATVGDLRNMGWIVSADKTTGTDGTATDTAYSETVKNANEVKFVGKDGAIVSGATDAATGVRTITVGLDKKAMSGSGDSGSPVAYTKADGTKVYPVKAENGSVTYHTTPNGDGPNDAEVPKTEVITSVNGPDGTTTPAALTNVAGNLVGAKKDTNAPTTEQAAPTVGKGANEVNPNNAATVGDVLNAGWNLQENGAAKDFVKPYDKVNFVNGGNTTAVVTTNAEGTVSNVSFNVTGLPVTYTTEDGKPVSKVGDKFYKVNEQGQPVSEAGKPAVKTNDAGKLVDEDGTEIEPINPATTPLKNALVNPNPAADKTGTTSPTQLTNVEGNLVGAKTGTDTPTTEQAAPTLGTAADQVNVHNVATVGDVLNAGWNLQENGTAKDFVKPYDKVNFVNGGNTTAVVTTNAEGTVSNVSFNVTGLPVTYTTEDGKPVSKVGDKFYKVNEQGQPISEAGKPAVKTNDAGKLVDEDGTEIEPINPATTPLKNALVNPNPAADKTGTTSPTQLTNVEGNLIGAKTGTDTPTTEQAAPTVGKGANEVNPNNAATVGDVLNAGWNLQENGTAKDFVKPYDKVNFVNGGNTTAVVTTNAEGTVSNVSFNVTGLPVSYTTEDGKPVSKVGDKFYKVNEQGQPVSEAGKPAVKTNDAGKLVDEDGTEIEPINPATTPLKNALVNPNPAADKTGTTSPTQLTNVEGNLIGAKTGTDTPTTEQAAPTLGTAANQVNVHNVATVGDVLNAGWNLQENGTAKDFVKPYDKVNFVNGGNTTAVVTTNAEGTVSNVSFNVTGLPVSYTTEDGKPVSKVGDKFYKVNEQGQPISEAGKPAVKTNDAGKLVDEDGTEIEPINPATTPLKTALVNPNPAADKTGTTSPTQLTNVEGNLVGAKTGTDTPTTEQAAPTLGTAANQVNVHNVATVGDVLNAGWNLQENGTAKDFVKPYDTVNFVNGGNTTAVVTTNAEGTVSNVSFNVTGLPVTYTTEDGKPVSKVGDKFYKVNEQGQPVSEAGKPAVKTNDAGKLVDEDGTEIEPINPATTPLKNALVNPNPAADKTGTTSPTALNNVTSGLNKYGDQVDGKPVEGTTPANTGLIDLSTPADGATPKVSDNTAATVGDLRNMGWIVSADKTTGDLDTAYSATVKNANEVKFVGTGTAIVSGETKDGVRTITVNVDDQVSTNNATTPVVYTKADGTKVYPIKGENGAITYHTTPDGKGNNDQEVPGTEVITSVNSPDGTTTPATLANVAGNLDGAKKDTTAPKAEAAAPNTTNKDGDKYINPNNAATVGDVLNAGWNLQENGAAKDFVKPYDTVNFVNGGNTTAVVTTNAEGTVSNVSFNVTGLPVTYTTEDGKPVSKVGDKFYKVNEQGQPVSEAGKPAVKTNDAGKLVDEDGTEIEPINPAATPLKTALVNPNPAADKTGTTSPTALNNVTSGLNKYGDQVDGKPVEGTTPANTGLIDLSTPADGTAPKVSDNTAATVGDLRNMGWIVSADKTTGDLDTAYSATVKNANEVKFVGTGTAIVSGETKDGVRTITVNVDDQVSTNNATTPVVYTKADGTKVYPIKGENGAITYHTTPNGKGKDDQEVPGNQVVTSVNGPEGTTSPTTLKNVKNSLPTVNDVDKTAHNVDGTTIDGKNNTAAPITAKDAADLLAPMKDGAANPKFVGNNAATVSDVLNAGWNLQENGAAKDFVKPYDTVNFVNGGNTIAVVTTNAEGTVSNVSFNVTGLPVTYTTEDGKPVSKVGDKFYKVNEQGQPISEAGKPAVKTNDAGKLVDEDGTEIEPINPATNPLKNVLVNPNPAADKTGTTSPTQLTNVEGNLVGAKTGTDIPTTEQAAPTLGSAADQVNVHNAATVGDVLNAGWNLQENGTAKDFVKPYDKVNFVNGGNTTAVVTTNAEGTVSNVSFNVTGLPVTYTTEDGKPVSKVGDKFYKVNEQGQPISEAGKPAVKTNDAGKLVDEDGTEIEPINPATTPLKNALVNPNPAADKTGTTSPTALNNVTSGLNKYGDQVDGKPVEGTTPANTGLIDLSTPADGAAPKVSDNTAATVGDLRNMGWIVSADKTTGDLDKAYSATVKNANEVKFVGTGTAIVSGETKDGVRTITVNVDDQVSTNNATTPVVYTKADGTKVYPIKGENGAITYHTTPDGKGKDDQEVPGTEVITSVNSPDGTTTPATLANVAGNLDGAKKDTTAPKAEAAAPNTTNKDGDKYINPNNAATVGDVLNAGWNLQENGTAKDFVKPYDTVNFINGANTTAVVTTSEDGSTSKVTYNVTGLPVTYTTEDGKPVSKVGDKFYKVNEKGQPLAEDGTPAAGTDKDGNPITADGTVIKAIDPTIESLKTALVNPNPAADKTGTTAPTQLTNVANGADTFKPENNVKQANDGKWYKASDVKPNGTPKTAAENNGTEPTPVANPLATKNAAGDVLERGNDGNWYKASDLENGEPKPNVDEQTPVVKPANTEKAGLVNFENSNPNNAATVGDLQNLGFVVAAHDNGYTEQMRNANKVEFKGSNGVSVTGKTLKDGTREITVALKEGRVTNDVIVTNADGTETHGVRGEDGKIYVKDPKTGKATKTEIQVAPTDTVTNDGDAYVTGNSVATAIQKSGWNIGIGSTDKAFSEKAKTYERVNPKDNVKYVNGGNTTVSMAVDAEKDRDGATVTTTYVKVDVNRDLNIDSVTTGGPAKDKDGNPLKLVDGKYYPENALVQDGKVYPAGTTFINGKPYPANTVMIDGKAYPAGSVKDPKTNAIVKDGQPATEVQPVTPLTATDAANVAPGKDGAMAVKDAKGNDGVSATAKDGKGTLTLNNAKAGKDGKDAASVAISTDKAPADLDNTPKDAVRANDGKWYAPADVDVKTENGTTVVTPKAGKAPMADAPTMDRIQYTGTDKKVRDVATMDDGLRFQGDDGESISKPLNSTVQLTGGNRADTGKPVAKDATTTGNIGVFNTDGKLSVQLAKDLDKLNSANFESKTDKAGNPLKAVDGKYYPENSVVQEGKVYPEGTVMIDNKPYPAGSVKDPNTNTVVKDGKPATEATPITPIDSTQVQDGPTSKLTGAGLTFNTPTPKDEKGNPLVLVDGKYYKTDNLENGKPKAGAKPEPVKPAQATAFTPDGLVVTPDTAKVVDPKTGEVKVDPNKVVSFGAPSIVTDPATGKPVIDPKTGEPVMKSGISAGGQVMSNVAPGVLDTDAVNVSQLKGVSNMVMNVNNRVNRLGAQAAAMAGLRHLQYDPLEPTTIMAGVGTYKGEGALALGIAHYKNESTLFHAGASIGSRGDELMANAGVSWKFGSRADETAVKDTFRQGPISASYTLQDKVSALEEQNQVLKEQVAELFRRLNEKA